MPTKKARLSLLLRNFFFSHYFTFWQTRGVALASLHMRAIRPVPSDSGLQMCAFHANILVLFGEDAGGFIERGSHSGICEHCPGSD